MRIGFTGTSKGMTEDQKQKVRELLTTLKAEHPSDVMEFHFGLCIGADEQAAIIAKGLGFRIVAHPGLPKDPTNTMYRSDWAGSDETRETKKFIERDQDIVNEVERMLATPLTRAEVTRSGTWTTVRYARKVGRLIDVILPPFVPPTYASAPPPKTNAVAGEDAQTPPHMKRGIR